MANKAKEVEETTAPQTYDAPAGCKEVGVFGKRWEPNMAGEKLVGTYNSIEQIPNKEGGYFDAYVIDDGEEQWSIAGAVLDRKMPRIPRGSTVTILYAGMVRTGKGRNAKDFKVFVAEATPILDSARINTKTGEISESEATPF